MASKFFGLVFSAVALIFVGCETSTQMAEVDPEAGLLKKANPAAVLNGSEVKLSGLVQVAQVGQRIIPAPAYGASPKKGLQLPVEKGACDVILEGSFNRDGKIYVFKADLNFEVEPTCHYYPVAGLEINSGKAWMWIQDQDHNVRVSERVEGRFIKMFEPAKENYLDLIGYESIIDPDVMADRKAVCDLPQVAGFQVDESYDRGDLSYSDRVNQ